MNKVLEPNFWKDSKRVGKMIDFTFPSERKGWIHGVRGTVISTRKWTETHVTASGNQGHVYSSGRVDLPTISTHITHKGEIWIKTKHGKDVRVPLNIPAIEGQDVFVLWGNLDEISRTTGPYMFWRNFSSDKQGFIPLPSIKFHETVDEAARRNMWFWGISIGIALLGCAMGGGGGPGFVIGGLVGLFVAYLFARPSKSKSRERAVKLGEQIVQLSSKNDVDWDG